METRVCKTADIGMLTFHQCHNVGAMLGAYALQQAVEGMGYSTEYIDIVSPVFIEHGKKAGHNLYRRNDEQGKKYKRLYEDELEKRWKAFESFYHGYLHLSPEVEETEDIIRQLEQYELILVGGDQLWNRNLEVALDYYYVPYAIDTKRISFGTSMGDSDIIDKKNMEWLKHFSYIGVREKAAVEYIGNYVECPVEVTNDSVFLIDRVSWEKLAVLPKEEGYIFAYIFCKNPAQFECQINELNQMAMDYGKKVVVCATDGFEETENLIPVVGVGPKEWLGYMAQADFVITNSFHGVAFSIVFNKDFLCIDSDRRKENLLSDYSLDDRLSRSIKDYGQLKQIDAERISDIRGRQKVKSYEYLKKALGESVSK